MANDYQDQNDILDLARDVQEQDKFTCRYCGALDESGSSACEPCQRRENVYTYYINLDERGCFCADVRNPNGKTVFEIKAGDELEEDETSIFEDGFMKHKDDMEGLQTYLRQLGFIPQTATIQNNH